MKRIMTVAAGIAMMLALSGCDSKKYSQELHETSAAYIEKMKKGQTTREQDQAFILAVENLSYQLDSALNGTNSAASTEMRGKTIGDTGFDPTQPLVLPTSKKGKH